MITFIKAGIARDIVASNFVPVNNYNMNMMN